jgi:hypothetical protein
MIHSAHASRYHWQTVGDASNKAIGEWQISRVYTVLTLIDPAHYHAKLCLEICATHSLGPFLKGCAHEAMARALCARGRSVSLNVTVPPRSRPVS